MLDFKKINDFGAGRRDSFEALLKVLAHREVPSNNAEYRPNDGRGGDGGVEAIWELADGSKVGYQSKFFDALGDAQWKQMDKSVAQALQTHTQLISYVFALPFDLTPDRGPKTAGKSQQQKWDEHVAKWKAVAARDSITIDFELWGATTLTDKLMRVGNGPLREHWFGERVLDDQWFYEQIASATYKLDDRFNPDDHVEVSVENLFDAIARGPQSRHRLTEAIENLIANPVPSIEFTTTNIVPDADALKTMQEVWDKLTSMRPAIDARPDIPWYWLQARQEISRLWEATRAVESPFYLLAQEAQEEVDRRKVQVISESLRGLSSAISDLIEVFGSPDLLAEAARCALVLGEAGSGKSHLLGQVASQRIAEGLPTVLILGQDMSDLPFWVQLGGLLGLEGKKSEEILGILNAVGERKGQRVLFLFDAINEGAGAGYWMHWMPEVVASVQSYPFIAAVFSCRDVYSRYAAPASLLSSLPTYQISGFSSPDERERAAIQYLDKKGISRPNMPWLSPEFSNPLFLKSTSEALLAKSEKEFPRGLHGISQLMALYVDGLSTRTGIRSVQAADLSSSLNKFIRSVAEHMAHNGQDFVTVDEANRFAKIHFESRQPPEGKTWLEVFIQTNLFRRDPPPFSGKPALLDPPSDLVRFSFQRFQDFLMAETLIANISATRTQGQSPKTFRMMQPLQRLFRRWIAEKQRAAIGKEFLHQGTLNFLFHDGDPSNGIRGQFAGLIGALSTIYPERLGSEFAKSFPDWERHWANESTLQVGFGESFKWRQLDAFGDESLELLEKLNIYKVDPLGLLLEVSMTIGHPFNAEHLHDHLSRFELAQRDSYWTQWINYSAREEFSQIGRIASWALFALKGQTDAQHVELAALALAWSLTSSDMSLRDRATKALTSLFLKQSSTFHFVLGKMQDCDDPYVIERLYAAAFGACCVDPSNERLQQYSKSVYDAVFANGEPPIALLTRDYALGIIELAEHRKLLDASVDLTKCYHPFVSNPPRFGLSEGTIKKIAEASGGERIFHSASSEMGDYGKYSIPGRIRNFLATPLSEERPRSKDELKQACYDEIISGRRDRVGALEALEKSSRFPSPLILRVFGRETDEEVMQRTRRAAEDEYSARLRDLEVLLTTDERQRLAQEYFGDGDGYGDYKRVDVQQCRWWITKRAYELGWTKKLFPRDGYGGDYSRQHNNLERIGKKYQRIALDELQARLADNFWSLQG